MAAKDNDLDVRRSSLEKLRNTALALPPSERESFLRDSCAGDPELKRRVEALLHQDNTETERSRHSTLSSDGQGQSQDARGPRPSAREPSMAHLDAIIGSYRVIDLLGKGGMGVVYRAKHVTLDKYAVIKMLRSRYVDTPGHKERFMNEAKVLATLQNPGIVDVYDVGLHTDGNLYIILEFLQGESMARYLQGVDRVAPLTAAFFIQQAARALAAVHERGIVHRDLKPGNLFIVPDAEVAGGLRVKILDFGIAKLAVSPDGDTTAVGALMGTPAYMAPEQWGRAYEVDGRADLYALGVILFRMLCGRLPFIKADYFEYHEAHVYEPPPRVRSLAPEVMPGLARMVDRLLAKRPADRYASALELVAALDNVLQEAADDESAAPAAGQATGQAGAQAGASAVARAAAPAVAPAAAPAAREESAPRSRLGHLTTASAQSLDSSSTGSPLWRVPALPPHFLARDDELAELVSALCAESDEAVGIAGESRHGVHGMGGIGKSVLAAAVARDERVRAHYDHGVYWLAVGQTPELTSLQVQLGRALGMHEPTFESPDDGKQRLSEYLAQSRVLLVLDDVWDATHASYLEVVGPAGRILVTTRNLDVLTWRDTVVHCLGVLSAGQAGRLLADWTGVEVEALSAQASQVADACGRLPLALAIAGALVRKWRGQWSRVLELLQSARLDKLRGQIPAYPYRNVYQVIEASVSQLVAEELVEGTEPCYADLSVFAEDEAIPRAALCVLWGRRGLDEADVDDLADALSTRALASLSSLGGADWHLSLHDIQRAYVHACTADTAALHGAFVDAWRARCERGLARGPAPTNDGEGDSEGGNSGNSDGREYFFRRLPYHLHQAGKLDDVRALLRCYSWLDSKLRATGVVELLADYERVDDPSAALIRDTLRLASHVLAKDPAQLPSQLVGRLGHFKGAEHDAIDALLESVHAEVEHPWLCPTTPNLTPPGGPLLHTLDSHADGILASTLSADGTRVLSGSEHGTLTLWNAHSGQLVRTFEGHSDSVSAVASSDDGARALAGSYDHTLTLWNAHTGALLRRFHRAAAGRVMTVALSGDGTRALSGSEDHDAALWDAGTGRMLRTFEGHSDRVVSVALSADGTRALTGSYDKTARLWDTVSGALVHVFSGHTAQVRAVAMSRDGALVFTGSYDTTSKVWDGRSGRCLRVLEGHSASVMAIAVNADGSRLLSGSHDRTLKLWDTGSGQCLRTFTGHSASVLSVALSHDGRRALSGSQDHTLKLWNTQSEEAWRALEAHSAGVTAVAMSGDGTRALSGSQDQTIKLWDPRAGQLLGSFEQSPSTMFSGITAAALSHDGRYALTGSYDETAKFWDTQSGRCLRTFEGHSARVTAVALSGDGSRGLTGSYDKMLALWDTTSGRHLCTFEGHTGRVMAAALSRDGTRVLSGAYDQTSKLWDARDGRLLHTFSGHSASIRSVALSADGSRALSGSNDKTLTLWDTASGRLLRTFEGHADWILAVALSSDGKTALSSSRDRTLKLWDTTTGEAVLTFTADRAISACALSAPATTPIIMTGEQSGDVHFLRWR